MKKGGKKANTKHSYITTVQSAMSTCFKIICFVAYKQTIARGETYHYELCYMEWGIFSNRPMILLKDDCAPYSPVSG